MSLEKVTRLRQLLSEATPAEARPPRISNHERRQLAHADSIHAQKSASATTPTSRGIIIRRINQIASWYGWEHEIQRSLDAKRTSFLSALNDKDLEAVLARLNQLEDCVQNGLGPPDAPPAS